MTTKTVPDARVSIGSVKRDISELVNRVAFGGERIVLTSRGNPKAALVSLEDLELIRRLGVETRRRDLRAARERNDRHVEETNVRRRLAPGELDQVLEEDRRDLEERSDWVRGQ
jgi:prevent-host-death family protein